MAGYEAELAGVIEASHDEMIAIAREVLDEGQVAATTPDDQLEQLVRALEAVMLEGLRGGSETKQFVIETAVPAYLEEGETAASLAAIVVSFALHLSSVLCAKMSDEHRGAAQSWLAKFYAGYVGDVVTAAAGHAG